jgi:glycerophosphoryl diester phosphodiesterase
MINNKLIIAHRGASFYEKENTIDSFKKAIELNSDMIEFDVRKTKDDIMIIFHDEKINKKYVMDMTYAEVIDRSKTKVPSLEETLKYLKGKIKLDIHLKEKGYEDEFMKLVLKYFNKNQIIICSEIPESLRKIKDKYPEIKTGFVIQVKRRNYIQIPFGFFQKNKISYSKVDYIMPPWQIINKIFLMKAQRLNKKLFPWVVNKQKLTIKLLKKSIVAGIITNIPDLIL